MYNRYVRNDQGQYARLPQEELQSSPPPQTHSDRLSYETPPEPPEPPSKREKASHSQRPTEMKLLNGLLDKLHLGDIDAGDLLLLVMLFLLFRENGDEELLIALGLLLIL